MIKIKIITTKILIHNKINNRHKNNNKIYKLTKIIQITN